MASQQSGPWQNAGRPRNSHSASRTPQNRSGTASPSQQNPSQPPRQEGGRAQQQTGNVWAQRSSSAGGSNGQTRANVTSQDEADQSVNGFNAADVKAFLARDIGSVTAYKPAEAAGGGRSSNAWGSKRESFSARDQDITIEDGVTTDNA
ncbi:hypothetical protein LTR37_002161 [Vermiconidia calcicola]|uniref:Uncharacterized protein n=1 Tax=Vermiconidia calcicola TaxID=1690605 RepID=A0ACC3NU04_9PEZI|nr:hypothetical protein LTR37_002161 [Vermiconidia calcicola]